MLIWVVLSRSMSGTCHFALGTNLGFRAPPRCTTKFLIRRNDTFTGWHIPCAYGLRDTQARNDFLPERQVSSLKLPFPAKNELDAASRKECSRWSINYSVDC